MPRAYPPLPGSDASLVLDELADLQAKLATLLEVLNNPTISARWRLSLATDNVGHLSGQLRSLKARVASEIL
jgi:hypothetical protein